MADFTHYTIDPAVERVIVDFLNRAELAVDIAGSEAQVGPVLDDPNSGTGDQSRGYDIGELVAGRMNIEAVVQTSE